MNIIEKAVEKLLGDKTADKPQPALQDSESTLEAQPGTAQSGAGAEPAVVHAEQVEPETSPMSSHGEDAAEVAVAAGDEGRSDDDDATADVITITNLGREGVLTADSERSREAEEYRMIKRPLLTRAFSGQGAHQAHRNLIMCTSSMEGEGKTFTALNLAISIAMELDRTVLLVDADLAKPGLSRMLNISNRPGLTDRLIDESIDLKELLLRTDVPKLTVLPAGRRHRRSTELLSSNKMGSLLDELALRYPDRVVMFDSPPLLATSEASVLAQQMGQICLVVESAVTPQYLVKDALSQLGRDDNVSLILNKCMPDLFLGGYGYGYGYRYGYGYGYGQNKS